jgi:1-deoxy-D-xylulose-5-phosphate reductoisomerase
LKRLAILGSTGSIGRQCLSVVESLPSRFCVEALAAGENIDLIASQIARHRPQLVSVANAARADELAGRLRAQGLAPLPDIQWGREGLLAVGTHPDVELLISAAVGVVGLEATYAAIQQGKQIALSNKEVLVAAGELVMAAAQAAGVDLLPVDSEHNAIHQCLRAGEHGEVKRLVLTASGGPFRKTPIHALARKH